MLSPLGSFVKYTNFVQILLDYPKERRRVMNKLKKSELIDRSKLFGTILLCGLFVVGLIKCTMPYDIVGVISTDGLLVVDAYIVAPTGSSIKLSRSKGLTESGDYEKVSNALVTVVNDRGDIIATAGENGFMTGEYVINDPLSFVAGTKYALDIVIGSEHFQSAFEEPLVTPEIDELGWAHRNNGYELDILLSTHDPLQQAEYYLWRYDEEWEYTARVFAGYRWDMERREVVPYRPEDNMYYCWDKSPHTSLIFDNVKSLQSGILKEKVIVNHKSGGTRFDLLYSIFVKQYAIPYEAYKYYENLRNNASETGGLFAPQPTEMDGNIVNLTNPDKSVIGYALIAIETNKRIYINGMDVPRMKADFNDRCMDLPVEVIIYSPADAYAKGWGIYDYGTTYSYRRLECVDCRFAGGSKRKPTFWPTDHM